MPLLDAFALKGFCFYKATNGIKRHLAVDTLGKPFFTHCTKANVSDDAGLVEMLRAQHRVFPLLTDEHSEDYHPIGSWLPPRASNTGALSRYIPASCGKLSLSVQPNRQNKRKQRKVNQGLFQQSHVG